MVLDKSRTEEVLLREYTINLELWKHYDIARQKKTENFLTINTILAGAIAVLIGGNFYSHTLIIPISIIGFALSVMWYLIMRRNSDYMRFQRLQLLSIEARLPKDVTTFTNMYDAFDKNKTVSFIGIKDKFKTNTISANKIDGMFPTIIAATWLLILLFQLLA